MLLDKYVEIGWNPTNRKHYESLGYQYEWCGKFVVPIEYLQDNSHVEIKFLCDYCKKEIIIRKWQSYTRSKKESITQKDCCRKCWNLKLEESLFEKYQVTNIDHIPEFIDKIKIKNRMSYEEVYNRFLEKGYILLISKEEYENNLSLNSKSKLRFFCPNHPDKNTKTSIDLLKQGANCKYCALENQAGENHWNWKGGISSLYQFLRYYIIDWKKESAKACNYKCVITGKIFNHIHHLNSFHLIVKKILDETKLKIYKNINEYSFDELELLKNKCIEIHKNIELGVCLSKEVHVLFHKLYGRKNNTSEQFYEFQSNYYKLLK